MNRNRTVGQLIPQQNEAFDLVRQNRFPVRRVVQRLQDLCTNVGARQLRRRFGLAGRNIEGHGVIEDPDLELGLALCSPGFRSRYRTHDIDTEQRLAPQLECDLDMNVADEAGLSILKQHVYGKISFHTELAEADKEFDRSAQLKAV